MKPKGIFKASLRRLSSSGIRRLSQYYRYVSTVESSGREFVFSAELAEATGHTADQVRRDLTTHASLGIPGKGYEIHKLKGMLKKALGKEKIWNVVLVGVGNLGSALLGYSGLQKHQFNMVAAFDNDLRKVGRQVDNMIIKDIRELKSSLRQLNVRLAIVTVPVSSAQEVVDLLVESGIEAILNFAPTRVIIPKGVHLQNVDLSIELDRLCYLLENPY